MPQTSFLAQPDVRAGDILLNEVKTRGTPRAVTFVSAFASLTTVLRFKGLFQEVARIGGSARIVVGIDLGGTSRQVLQEIAGWGVPVFIVKNAQGGITFHPKIYLMEWASQAILLVGSNNLTDGGLFRNSEAASLTTFTFSADYDAYREARNELARFLEPRNATSKALTPEYLATLMTLPEIPTEAEARRRRADALSGSGRADRPEGVFGSETVSPPPTLPTELQALVLAARAQQRAAHSREASRFKKTVAQALAAGRSVVGPAPSLAEPFAILDPVTFYMTLPTMRADSSNIPGEMRIPMEALETAPDFWGWPDQYVTREVNPRAVEDPTEDRNYFDRRAIWRTSKADGTGQPITAEVRMYVYTNSSDFRQMVGALNTLQGRKGDIVRISLGVGDIDYECRLAPVDSPRFEEWEPFLTQRVRNSDRRFGFA